MPLPSTLPACVMYDFSRYKLHRQIINISCNLIRNETFFYVLVNKWKCKMSWLVSCHHQYWEVAKASATRWATILFVSVKLDMLAKWPRYQYESSSIVDNQGTWLLYKKNYVDPCKMLNIVFINKWITSPPPGYASHVFWPKDMIIVLWYSYSSKFFWC